MRASVNILSREGFKFPRENFISANDNYVKLINRRCEELYNLSYIDSPSVFEFKYFLDAFIPVFKEEVFKYFRSRITGKSQFSLLHLDYALGCEDADSEFHIVVEKLRDIKKSQQMFSLISELVKRPQLGVNTRGNKVPVFKTTVFVSSGLKTKSKKEIDVFSESFFELVTLGLDTRIFEIGDAVRRQSFSMIVSKDGVSRKYTDDDYDSHYRSGRPFFLGDSFSLEDELRYLPLILNGDIIGDGKYADEMFSAIKAHYKALQGKNITAYYNNIFSLATDELVEEVRKIREENYNLGGNLVFLDSTYIVFSFGKKEEGVSDSIDTVLSSYMLDNTKGRVFQLVNRVRGFGGEYISEHTVKKMNLVTLGLPIDIIYSYLENENKSFVVRRLKYYSLQNLLLVQDSENYIRPTVGTDLRVTYSDLDSMLSKVDCFDLDSLERYIFSLVDVSLVKDQKLEYSFKLLVSKIVRVIFCVESDTIEEGRSSSGHLYIESGMRDIDEYHYCLACFQAEHIISSLNEVK